MPEPTTNTRSTLPAGAELHRAGDDPKGVLPRNLKPWLYIGAALLVIVAAVFSGTGKKTEKPKSMISQQAVEAALQDSTASNRQELKSDVSAAEQRTPQGTNAADPPTQNVTPAQQAAAAAYGPNGEPNPCISGRPCAQAPNGYAQQQLSPAQQEAQQIAARDRELSYDSRFASNLVYTRAPVQPTQKPSSAALANSAGATGPQQSVALLPTDQNQFANGLIRTQTAGEPVFLDAFHARQQLVASPISDLLTA